MKGNQNANMSREDYNNVTSKQTANTAYNGNELYNKGIVRGKIFILPEEMRNERVEITLNEGYQFVDENGNAINATKIVLEKKKKEYPITYCECKNILGLWDIDDTERGYYKADLIDKLQMLLICRDAYWKIAGEEMGLGKPWEPDWSDASCSKYIIDCFGGEICKGITVKQNTTFAFPTEEMRDAFKYNFDPDIEICKELL